MTDENRQGEGAERVEETVRETATTGAIPQAEANPQAERTADSVAVPSEERTDVTSAPEAGERDQVDAPQPATPGQESSSPGGAEAIDPAGASSEKGEEEAVESPRFRPQHEEEVAPDEKRPIGWSNPVREPSEASKNQDAAFLMGSRMTTAFEGHPGVQPFTGKRMVIKLGLGSKYVFDGEKVPKALKTGRGNVPGENAPIDIVIGNVKDVNNKRQADKKNMMLDQDRAMDIQAMALQAAAVMKARDAGANEPIGATDTLVGRFGEGAPIIAERIDALSPEDLKLMSESRVRDTSHAAQRMMVYGVPTRDLGRAAEMVTTIAEDAPEIAGDPREGQESKTPTFADQNAKVDAAATEMSAGAAGPTASAEAKPDPVREDASKQTGSDVVAPAANDSGPITPQAASAPRSIVDQAREVAANDGTAVVQSKGPEASNDAAAALLAAAARNAQSRD